MYQTEINGYLDFKALYAVFISSHFRIFNYSTSDILFFSCIFQFSPFSFSAMFMCSYNIVILQSIMYSI